MSVQSGFCPVCLDLVCETPDECEHELALQAGYAAAERFGGERYAEYVEEHDAELRAKGHVPTPWPTSLLGNDGA